MVPFQVSCDQFKAQLGCHIKGDWFDTVRATVDQAPETERLNLLFALFLEADMNVVGAGSLPSGLKVSFFLYCKGLSLHAKAAVLKYYFSRMETPYLTHICGRTGTKEV